MKIKFISFLQDYAGDTQKPKALVTRGEHDSSKNAEWELLVLFHTRKCVQPTMEGSALSMREIIVHGQKAEKRINKQTEPGKQQEGQTCVICPFLP